MVYKVVMGRLTTTRRLIRAVVEIDRVAIAIQGERWQGRTTLLAMGCRLYLRKVISSYLVESNDESTGIHFGASVVDQIKDLLNLAGLTLANLKTKVVLITSNKWLEYANIEMGNRRVRSNDSFKYLGDCN